MVFQHIERLQKEYTDKFVVVVNGQADLVRFQGLTGTVKTINMSGRALVQFDQKNDTAWYDINVDFLKVVDEPLEKKDPQTKHVNGAVRKSAESKADTAVAKESPSADILAAAPNKSETQAPVPKKDTSDNTGIKPDQEMSVAEVLAAARGDVKTADPQEATEAEQAANQTDSANQNPVASSAKKHPRSELPTDVPSILEYCRRVDS